EAARRYPPERVADRTGIPPEEIRALARDFATAPSAVAYGRVGSCTQEFGGLTSWPIVALNAVTGNLDRPGGSMFTTPAAVGGGRGCEQENLGPRALCGLAQQGARPARVWRRASRGNACRRDRNPRQGTDPSTDHLRRQSGALNAEWRPVGTRLVKARLHGV